MMPEVFLDTSYAIALSSERDRFHGKAVELAEKSAAEHTKLITTRPVLLEIGNALSGLRFRAAAVKLLTAPVTESLYRQAFSLFCQRDDKNWGLIDCISFVVMQERKITHALTADEHFHQAGLYNTPSKISR